MAVELVKIDGLRDFTRDLKVLDRELPKAVRIALNDAADIVVDDARPRVPQRSGRARRSIRAASTRTKVRVRAGGRRAPYYPWLDFGGRVGRRRSIHRPVVKNGRYLYPSYFRARDRGDIQLVAQRALLKVAESAGIEVD